MFTKFAYPKITERRICTVSSVVMKRLSLKAHASRQTAEVNHRALMSREMTINDRLLSLACNRHAICPLLITGQKPVVNELHPTVLIFNLHVTQAVN